jgi:hypothetical protein
MKLVRAAPAPASAICTRVYVVGGYQFQIAADRALTSHEAIGYAALWMHQNPAQVRKDCVNTVAVSDDAR